MVFDKIYYGDNMNIVSVIVIFVILFVVALTTKKKNNIFLVFGLIDIFLRIMDYIGEHTISEVNNIINKIFPNSIPAIIYNYTDGTLSDILMWGYILLMAIFFYEVLRLLMKRY